MSSVLEKQNQLVADFSKLTDWEDRYKKIIEYGKLLPEMPENLKTEENKVKGCQSQVWLTASLNEKNEVHLQGESDALLVKGLLALLIRVYSEETPDDILKNPPEFLKTLGFEANLSPSRSNGLHSMIKQIQLYATAFKYLLLSRK